MGVKETGKVFNLKVAKSQIVRINQSKRNRHKTVNFVCNGSGRVSKNGVRKVNSTWGK